MKKIYLISFIISIILTSLSYGLMEADPSVIDERSGVVVSVIDGDTYDLLVNGNVRFRVRMEGIDAPERGMAYYRQSKDYLTQLCAGKRVRIQWIKKDRNNRVIAYSYLPDGRELSHEMIKAGWAWHFTKYNTDQDLAALQRTARQFKRGLWKDHHPVAPWDYRKSLRTARKRK